MNIPTPAGLELRPYQSAGVQHLVGGHALLADEPGLGKTIQVAAALNCAAPDIKVLVGCPETLMLNWMRELDRWLTPRRSIGLATTKRVPETEVVIANYDIFPRIEGYFREMPFSIAVLDEAHRIKDPESQRTQAAGLISARCRWALTGTPILNRPIEAWTVLWWLLREQVMPYPQYAAAFCGAHLREIWRKILNKQTGKLEPKKKKVWDLSGATRLDELNTYLLGPARMLRRRKEEVLTDLPSKTHQIIELNAERVRRMLKTEQAMVARMGGYEEAISKLQDGEAVGFEQFTDVRHELALAKMKPAAEFIEDALAEEAKVVVFCHHRDVLSGLAQELRKFGVAMVWGGMSAGDKDQAVQAFQNDGRFRVFIGNDAACEGLTLTTARRCIFVELDPVPGRMIQFEDRLHRMGQKSPVLVQALVFEQSLDVRLLKLLWTKSKVIKQAVDGL